MTLMYQTTTDRKQGKLDKTGVVFEVLIQHFQDY